MLKNSNAEHRYGRTLNNFCI